MGGGAMRGRAFHALLLCLVMGAIGCRKELPPRLPSTAIHDRTASRVGLVDFVISDRTRAKKVRALYGQIEQLMLEAHRVHMAEARVQAQLGAGRLVAEDEIRASLAMSRDAEMSALERYICLELAIRALTTPEEFARLDAIK
jgi:hypothetical protein